MEKVQKCKGIERFKGASSPCNEVSHSTIKEFSLTLVIGFHGFY